MKERLWSKNFKERERVWTVESKTIQKRNTNVTNRNTTNLAAKAISHAKLSRDQIPHGMMGEKTSCIVLTQSLSMKGLASLQHSSSRKQSGSV